MVPQVVHSSVKTGGRDEWRTPQALFDHFNAHIGGFDIDAAADADNHLAPIWYGPGGLYEDALTCPWGPMITYGEPQLVRPARFWLNPPYSVTDKFLLKAAQEAQLQRAHVIALVAARTDTKVFHEVVLKYATKLYFIKGRLHFGDPSGIITEKSNPAPFPSLIVEFRYGHKISELPVIETLIAKDFK